jgi:tartrate dehydrogenase/decarboxylase/D-malate dehydrogenase
MMKTYRIATVPGDSIGKEVVPAGQQVLEALAASNSTFRCEFENFDWGGDYFREHGVMMPDNGVDALRNKDALLFGSAGDPDIPDHITLWGLRLKICQGFDQYANVRPTRILPGIDAPLKRCKPEGLDWVIVRENSEGEYSGVGGRVHQGHSIEAATDVSMMTRVGGRAHHALRLPPGRIEATQAADGDHQMQRPAPRNGDVGRDRDGDLPRVPGR